MCSAGGHGRDNAASKMSNAKETGGGIHFSDVYNVFWDFYRVYFNTLRNDTISIYTAHTNFTKDKGLSRIRLYYTLVRFRDMTRHNGPML